MPDDMREYADAVAFAQGLPPPGPIHTLGVVSEQTGVSARTVRRRIQKLEEIGLAECWRGGFYVKREVVSQPLDVLDMLYPSLVALKGARRFGRRYSAADAAFVRGHLPEGSVITLDYRAAELTGYQVPRDLCAYVDDAEGFCTFLRGSGFSEGRKGSIVILSKIGSFDDEKRRVFLDCVAQGGRGFNDAVAMSLSFDDIRRIPVRFTMELVDEVSGNMNLPLPLPPEGGRRRRMSWNGPAHREP